MLRLSAGAGDPRTAEPKRPADGLLACQRHDPDLWFAEHPGQVELAKSLCAGCPLREACLAGALDRGEIAGVWGGELLVNGMIVEFKRGRGRPRKSAA